MLALLPVAALSDVDDVRAAGLPDSVDDRDDEVEGSAKELEMVLVYCNSVHDADSVTHVSSTDVLFLVPLHGLRRVDFPTMN